MKFFEKRRVSTYIHGGKFKKDAKSGVRMWTLNLVVTLKPADVECCDEAILSNFQQLDATENKIEEIKLAISLPEFSVDFFGLSDHTAPILSLGRCQLSEVRMTREGELCELWVKAQHDCTDALHVFVKEYAFQRLWVEFCPRQTSLAIESKPPKEVRAVTSKVM